MRGARSIVFLEVDLSAKAPAATTFGRASPSAVAEQANSALEPTALRAARLTEMSTRSLATTSLRRQVAVLWSSSRWSSYKVWPNPSLELTLHGQLSSNVRRTEESVEA